MAEKFDPRSGVPVSTDAAKLFLTVWRDLTRRSAPDLPLKSDLDPAALTAALSHFWLYRQMPDRTILCHFTGEDVTSAWGAPTRGKPLSQIIRNGMHKPVEARFNLAMERRLLVHGINHTPGAEHSYAERIYGPLRDEDGTLYVAGISVYRSAGLELLENALQSLEMDALRAYDALTLDYIGTFHGTDLDPQG